MTALPRGNATEGLVGRVAVARTASRAGLRIVLRNRPEDRVGNVRETEWKIEGKTGQRAELSNVRETGWKIEGMTDGKTGLRTGMRTQRELFRGIAQRIPLENLPDDRAEHVWKTGVED